jgi:formate-dependent nitrite reductase cytochrome c552 subunit
MWVTAVWQTTIKDEVINPTQISVWALTYHSKEDFLPRWQQRGSRKFVAETKNDRTEVLISYCDLEYYIFKDKLSETQYPWEANSHSAVL